MKFNELKVGNLFEFEGEGFVKASPLMAKKQTNGEQKFMHRSAEVTVTDSPAGNKPAFKQRRIDNRDVQRAFEVFYNDCQKCLMQLSKQADDETIKNVQQALEQAKQAFWRKLI